jgi:nondiscriminating glutamyl-tRNA synthetase
MMPEVRVRFAPSPTGYLHVGGARTALFNYLFAKKNKGKFILRVEDTDLERSTEESLRMQVEDLKWLGLFWHEGVDSETLESFGEYGPYRQSERLDIYKEHALRLISSGQAYYCFLTDDDIEEQRKTMEKGQHITSPFREMDPKEALKRVDNGDAAVIRFKTSKQVKTYAMTDLVRGHVSFQSDLVGDFVILRSNGMPVYNFCCAIDDALMKITHVLRAEEHLNNSLRQLMVYEAFDYTPPQFGHMSLILGSDKQKLSKRHGATSCHEYKVNGYLPEALVNFIALLGWSGSADQEIFEVEEIAENFHVEKLTPSAAVFDETKLKWMNSVYIKKADTEVFWKGVLPHIKEAGIVIPEDDHWRFMVQKVFKPRMETFKDAVELMRPLSDVEFIYDEKALEALGWDSSKTVIDKWAELVSSHADGYISEEQFDELQNEVKTQCGVKGKNLFMPLRVAIIGQAHGADLKLIVPLMSKELLLKRAGWALGKA